MTIEGLRLKLLEIRRKSLADYRRNKIHKSRFTIISNNCWGGECYESYNLIKQSPTIGLFFMATDYIKFISNIKHYLNQKIEFINPKESKYFYSLKKDPHFGSYPVGKLDDIEIFFMHYSSEEQVLKKWNRRIKRINWDHIIYKFNDQNGCTEKDIQNFEKLPYKNKICFSVNKKYKKYSDVVIINAPKSHKFISASYEPFGNSKYININEIINEC